MRATIEPPLPPELLFPLVLYGGRPATPRVRVGQRVLGGEWLGDGIPASTSGTIVSIEARVPAHPSGLAVPSVVLEPDGRDRFRPIDSATRLAMQAALADDGHEPAARQRVACLDALREAGLRGSGGAGFATADKIEAATTKSLDLLLINAMECEPGVASDTALVAERAEAVLDGVYALMRLCRPRRTIIAVERDNERMLRALREVLDRRSLDVRLQPLAAIYPSGAERHLVRLLTGVAPQPGVPAVAHGVLCVNVTTVAAVADVLAGRPSVARIVTLGGPALPESRNATVRFGTPVDRVLEAAYPGIELDPASQRVRWGGRFSGVVLPRLDVPVSATTHALHVETPTAGRPPDACIRCGECARVCPERLQAQQLYRYARIGDLAAATRFGIDACITCGCCDVVCPAELPLTDLFRHARSSLARQRVDAREAERLAVRHHDRERRETERARVRAEAARRQTAAVRDPASAATALARIQARRRSRKSS